MDKDETLKNAFNLVRQTHIELASLYKDLEAVMENAGFISAHSKREIGTERRLSLDSPDYWLYPFTSRFFVEVNCMRPANRYLGISMIHYNRSEDKPIIPRMLIGIAYRNQPYYKEFKDWWLVSMYESEWGKEIKEGHKNGELIANLDDGESYQFEDEEWFKIIPKLGEGKGSEWWYDHGYIYSKRLTEIRNREDVKGLADTLINKYGEVSSLFSERIGDR
jgi:hypothetical protein